MKKRIYFLISSMVQIVAAVFSMMSADKIISALKDEAMAVYPAAMGARIDSFFTPNFIYLTAIICIILNTIIIFLTLQDKLLKRRGVVIACSIAALFFSFHKISQLLAILNVVVIVSCKREKEADNATEKKKIPVLKKEKIDAKKVIFSALLMIFYLSFGFFDKFIPDSNKFIYIGIQVLFYVLMVIFSILVFRDLLRENFNCFRKNFRAYLQNLLPVIGKFYLVYFGIAIVVAFLSKTGVSANQKTIEALPPYVIIPLAILYAPLVEEILFRGCIRRFIKNDTVFIIVSGMAFGLMHTITSETALYNIIVNAIPYMTLGGFLAYLYTKTNNICTNMAMHFSQNFIAVLFTILI